MASWSPLSGNYDEVNRLCAELASEYPTWAFVNVNVRSYYAEGSKTLAFEVAEQLGWTAPDHVVVPIASGSQLTKVAKGFRELYKVGLLDEEPHVRISGAQAAGCAPVAAAFEAGADFIRPVKPTGIAKSLAIGNPADGAYALDEVRRSGGAVAAVTDTEIVDGIRLLARTEGIFAETAGGVTVAVLAKLARIGRRQAQRAGGGVHHRQRLEDPRRGRRRVRPDRDRGPNLDGFQAAVNVADWQ